ncbi:DUF302 domain-containing protein [Fulvivirga sp. M361]|uniref:DUF302 domain-containing protein n=1 Tax=Fulvivirga sp. M361 TaxID=2594266 RepID=UPI001179DC11|nr:DUF302 domain-containing protein [Fulvivirga sp. M361]TRX61867.1 DUF302 domain-containing protein [Fulvivirga sp. M361]
MRTLQYFVCLVILSLNACNTSQKDSIMNTNDILNKGLVTKTSNVDFETTYRNLKNALEANPNLKILLELDHSKNAGSVGLDLDPTRIIMFGNPKLGTLLMQHKQTAGIDLPQKIIVYRESDGQVKVAYNHPIYLQERHELNDHEEVLNKVGTALDNITEIAIGK